MQVWICHSSFTQMLPTLQYLLTDLSGLCFHFEAFNTFHIVCIIADFRRSIWNTDKKMWVESLKIIIIIIIIKRVFFSQFPQNNKTCDMYWAFQSEAYAYFLLYCMISFWYILCLFSSLLFAMGFSLITNFFFYIFLKLVLGISDSWEKGIQTLIH